MTPSLPTLIARDLEALAADMLRLEQRVTAVRHALRAGDLHVVPSRTALAEDVAQTIRDRLREVSVQTSGWSAR